MKLIAFSDIHGNYVAFLKALKLMRKESPDIYLFCGDICGYYYQQNEIIEELLEFNNLISVMGNHDQLFLDCYTDRRLLVDYTQKYGRSFEILIDNITDQSLSFLRESSLFWESEDGFSAAFHGSPSLYLNGYVYPDTPLDEFMNSNYRYVFLGHTHYPMDRVSGMTRFINPGSIGQPRDCNEGSFAVVDLIRDHIEIIRFEYDTDSVINQVKAVKEKHSYLEQVLLRSRV